jgi:hypothetical protein
MFLEWIAARIIPTLLMIATSIYVIMVAVFFVDVWKKEQEQSLHQSAIAECLNSGGHIGQSHPSRRLKKFVLRWIFSMFASATRGSIGQ